jgi:F420-dependent oxidoreductase-like protein
MRTAVILGYWGSGPPPGAAELFEEAERLGFDQIWTAEAYGSDAWTPLAWWGSRTSRIKLGTAVSQLSARPPSTLAMTAMTMDHLSQGRVLLGIGTSNPQVVEGWYGQPYQRPLERTREYIQVLRAIIAREEPVLFEGKHYQLPLRGEGSTGLGKPLRSILHPFRTEIPIYLGAEGPKNVALGAEIADGWNLIFFSPKMHDFYAAALAEGFARPGARHTAETFDVVGGPLAIVPHDNVEEAADLLRPTLALYIGGMGARGVNFHHEVFVRMGYEAVAKKIQDHYLAGDKKSAIAAVPTALVEDVALIGPWDKIAAEIPLWKNTLLTTFSVQTDQRHLERVAELLRDLLNRPAGRHVVTVVGSMRGLSLPRRTSENAAGAAPIAVVPRVAGAALLVASGGIHLDLYLTGYRTIPTIGWLFLLQVIAGFALALAILVRWRDPLAAAAGALFALATLGGYLLSLRVGLFGFHEVRTEAGIVAGIIEVLAFVALAVGIRVVPWRGVAVISVVALAVFFADIAVSSGGTGQTAGTLQVRDIGGERILVNAKGLTVYSFAPDTPTASRCYGTCAAYWPPVLGRPAAGAGVTGAIGTITRTGGAAQATYDGHPLYTYVGDTAPGQDSGNGLNLNGGLWRVVTP